MDGTGEKLDRPMRSAAWYGGDDRDGLIHRAWMWRGLPEHAFDGRPHIAIANTFSDLTPCNSHLGEVAEHVKRGVYEAGGIPVEIPMVSLGETLVRPTAMLWRNMAAMAVEELLRANPVDGVVMLGGCDKTIPALLMGAASVNLPGVVVPGGPMLSGTFRGTALGCGTDVWRLSEEVRAGTLSPDDVPAGRVRDDPQPRPLQHHGHRLDDGSARRGARHDHARAWRAPRPPTRGCCRPPITPGRLAVRARGAAAHRRGRGHRGLVPQRDRHAGRHRRLDQRRRPSAGDRRQAGHRPHARRLRPDRCGRARCWSTCSRRGSTSWRTCSAPAGCWRCCARCVTCCARTRSPSPGGRSSATSTTRRSGTATSSAAARARCSRPPGSRCSPATSRRAGRSSNRPRRRPSC